MGVIIRDAKGTILIARTRRRELCSLLLTEYKATLMGLRTTNMLGIKNVVIEGNSMEVINALVRDMEECPNEIRICILL